MSEDFKVYNDFIYQNIENDVKEEVVKLDYENNE